MVFTQTGLDIVGGSKINMMHSSKKGLQNFLNIISLRHFFSYIGKCIDNIGCQNVCGCTCGGVYAVI